jgi:NADPH:quinone reductase-like Zn-dependent oxidoreductase
VLQGLQLAKALGAKIVALHVTTAYHALAASAAALIDTREQSEKRGAEFSKQIFDAVAHAGRRRLMGALGFVGRRRDPGAR